MTCIHCDGWGCTHCKPDDYARLGEQGPTAEEVRIAELEGKLRVAVEALTGIASRPCYCTGWGGPCGCSDRMRDDAEEALARLKGGV